jgi:hypothetical protein
MQKKKETPLPTERLAGTIYTERIEIDPKNPVTILDGGKSPAPYSPKPKPKPNQTSGKDSRSKSKPRRDG